MIFDLQDFFDIQDTFLNILFGIYVDTSGQVLKNTKNPKFDIWNLGICIGTFSAYPKIQISVNPEIHVCF